jgi:hypothetical protein
MFALQSAASGTLLLTAANLANLAAIHPPTVTVPKQMDTASVASSTHFTVVNGLGRPTTVYRKSWCARNQLTVLVCTMSFLFMVGLLAGILYMESEYPQHQRPLRHQLLPHRCFNIARAISADSLSAKPLHLCLPLIAVRARDKYN